MLVEFDPDVPVSPAAETAFEVSDFWIELKLSLGKVAIITKVKRSVYNENERTLPEDKVAIVLRLLPLFLTEIAECGMGDNRASTLCARSDVFRSKNVFKNVSIDPKHGFLKERDLTWKSELRMVGC